MAATTMAATGLFDPELVTDLINKVKGRSSVSKLSAQTPISFTGNKEFTFSMDSEIDVVAESGAKSAGGVTLSPVTILPIKFEYGARVTDEFMYATEDRQLDILTAFNDGFSSKVAKGLDIAAFHGLNPRTSTASTVIGTNHFDSKVTQTVTYDSTAPDDNVGSAVSTIQSNDCIVTGVAMSTAFATAMAALKSNNQRLYPELYWGGNPDTVNGLMSDVNTTVSFASSLDRAIVGDFENCFKWGYAKEIPFEIIPYGDPDNSGLDLKGQGQVYLRSEIFLGWGILNASAFARVVATA